MKRRGKHAKKVRKIRASILLVFSIILIGCIIYVGYNLYGKYKDKKDNTDILATVKIDEEKVSENVTKRMIQLKELRKENSEIIAWIEIEGTNISYPVCQTDNNQFYLDHNYKKESSQSGSLFLDKDFDLQNGSSNYLIYGHRNQQGLMFEDLLKYKEKEFYKKHKKIKFTTEKEDSMYEILAVFYSRVYYKSEKNVFRYYYFVNANNEQEYNEYVENSKKASLYDTGVTASFKDQLLTLSTCEYSQEDGRFVVVARKAEN